MTPFMQERFKKQTKLYYLFRDGIISNKTYIFNFSKVYNFVAKNKRIY